MMDDNNHARYCFTLLVATVVFSIVFIGSCEYKVQEKWRDACLQQPAACNVRGRS